MALVKHENGDEMVIKPEAVAPNVDTSGWPLLLRNWDQCESRQQQKHKGQPTDRGW